MILAIYGFVDLVLLLTATVINERVMPIFHSMGSRKNWQCMSHRENPIEGMFPLKESAIRLTKISTKGRVTIPAELRERFGLKKGTRIDWTKDGSRLVLTPIKRLRKTP